MSDKFIDDMLTEASGPINFTMFLTLFGEKLAGTDPEDVCCSSIEPLVHILQFYTCR